jgi:hypothetical protein
MKKRIFLACVAMALAFCNEPSRAAQTYFGGSMESIVDTSGGGCGETVGEHQWFQYRAYAGDLPGTFFVRGDGATLILQALDTNDFKMDGTPGTLSGTVLFNGNGPPPGIYQQTVRGSYTMLADTSDPSLIQITRLTLKLGLRPSGTSCRFIFMGVMSPLLISNTAARSR